MSALNRSRKRRGYLLLEVSVAGAMAAVVIGGLLVQLASAQSNVTQTARRQTAQTLAATVLNETRSRDFDSISGSNGVRSVGGGTYIVGVAVTPNFSGPPIHMISLDSFNRHPFPGDPHARSNLSMNYKDISVTVMWHAPGGDRTEMVQSRAYRLTPVNP